MAETFKKIDSLCNERGISIAQMCRETGVSKSCISELKSGRTNNLSTTNAKKIANFFGVSIDFLSSDVKANGIIEAEERITDHDLKFALFNGSEGVTDEMFEEVKRFAEMVKLREEAKNK